jgi:FdhD protein
MMPENGPSPTTRPIVRWEAGQVRQATDDLAEEEPLEIRVRGRAISVTMRTAGHDPELAAGFLFTEGIIRAPADIWQISPCERNEFGNLINVQLAPEVPVDFEQLTRHVFASSSCGLCGKATIESIHSRFAPIQDQSSPIVQAETLAQLPDKMRSAQSAFDRTGGIHAAAIFSTDGKLIVLREDVGRHNAVDKVLGYALLHGLMPLDQHVLLVSGRSSFEIVQKALAGRVPIIAAVSAPSSLAVQFSEENHQTLVGFLRPGRMNVYTGAERVRFAIPGR